MNKGVATVGTRRLVGIWRVLVLVLASTVSLAAGLFGGLLHEDGCLAEGVYIQGQHLGRLKPLEAKAKLRQRLEPTVPAYLHLALGEREWRIANAGIGRAVRYDQAIQAAYDYTRQGNWLQIARHRLDVSQNGRSFTVPVVVEKAKLRRAVEALKPEIDRPPAEARVVDMVGDELYMAPEQDGLTLDVEASLAAALGDGLYPPPARIELVAERVAPKYTVADLRGLLNTRLAAYTTDMAHGYYGAQRANRSHNVRLCLEKMNGIVLAPGEEFSFNDRLGERRAEDGFRSSYVFKRKPDGTVEEHWETGGGICQLATTLFNAALYANLKITERHPHSKPVHYARPGRDATVYFGVVDLRFVNSLGEPIMLWGDLDADLRLTIAVWGNSGDDTEVDLATDGWSGRLGPGAELYRTVRDREGKLVEDREHLFSSSYRSGD